MIAVARRTAPATELRAEYLDSLPEPQELFVESLVAAGTWWSIRRQDQEIGYAVIGSGLDLLELYLRNDALKHLTEAFDALVEVCDVRSILAKSFDSNLMSLGLSRPVKIAIAGVLYRVIVDPSFTEDARIRFRPAKPDDAGTLMRLGADFFDSIAEIEDYIGWSGLFVYETAAGEALGAGVMRQVVPGRDDIDIGMVVGPEHRHRGYGSYIVAHLQSLCLSNGWRPICGCSIDNLGSQRTLERAGFASGHNLVEFHLL